MTRQEFATLCMKAVRIVRERCPRDTGNLRSNGVNYAWDGDDFIIYVDEEKAPYMPYTNEPWISPKWNGKKNPNEAWWKDATELVKEFIMQELNGENDNDNS